MTVRRERGFSLLELVFTIAVMAVAFGVLAPKIMDHRPVRAAAGARQLAADIRFAQRLAATLRTPCGVRLDPGGTRYTVFKDAAFTPAEDPVERAPFVVDLAARFGGVTFGPAAGGTVSFDPRGKPTFSPGFLGTFTVGAHTLAIEPDTGAVIRR